MLNQDKLSKLQISFWKMTNNFSAIISTLQNEKFENLFIKNYGQKDIGTPEFNDIIIFSIKKENSSLQKALNDYLIDKHNINYKDYVENLFFSKKSFFYNKLNKKVYDWIKKTYPQEMTQTSKVESLIGKYFVESSPQDFKHVLNENLSLNLSLDEILKESRYFLYESTKKTDKRLKALIDANLVESEKTEHIDAFVRIYHSPSEYLKNYFNLPATFNLDFFDKHPKLVKFKKYEKEFVNLNLSQMSQDSIDKLYKNINEIDDSTWKKLVKNNINFFSDKDNIDYLLIFLINNFSQNISYPELGALKTVFDLIKEPSFFNDLIFKIKEIENNNVNKVKDSIIELLFNYTPTSAWEKQFKENFQKAEEFLMSIMDSVYYHSDKAKVKTKEKIINLAIDNNLNIFETSDAYHYSLFEMFSYIFTNEKKPMPIDIVKKVESLLDEEILLSKTKENIKVAQKLFYQQIDILKLCKEKNIDPYLGYEIPLEALLYSPNFKSIPQKVIDYYINETTQAQLLTNRGYHFKENNLTHYLSMEAELFNIYFKDDKLFNALTEDDKVNILNNFLSFPQEVSANHLFNSTLNWPWEKANTQNYKEKNFIYLPEDIKEKMNKKIEYIVALQEKEKLENIFKSDIIEENIKETTKPKKRSKI